MTYCWQAQMCFRSCCWFGQKMHEESESSPSFHLGDEAADKKQRAHEVFMSGWCTSIRCKNVGYILLVQTPREKKTLRLWVRSRATTSRFSILACDSASKASRNEVRVLSAARWACKSISKYVFFCLSASAANWVHVTNNFVLNLKYVNTGCLSYMKNTEGPEFYWWMLKLSIQSSNSSNASFQRL